MVSLYDTLWKTTKDDYLIGRMVLISHIIITLPYIVGCNENTPKIRFIHQGFSLGE
jgi:hypothetical protein